MDVALAVVDALRQIYALRKAILRQRRVNEETYLQMMEIFVELHSSEGVQVNATLRRTAAVEKFSEAVIKFSSYLQKYDHMCRVVRLFKLAAMEEERLEIVGEIDQVLRMLNFASAVTVMNGAVAVSRNTARLRAKLEEMHGDIKLGHDQLLAALLAKKKQQHADQGPVLEERSSNRVGVDQVLVHQVSVLTACEGDEQANPPLQALGDILVTAGDSISDTVEGKSPVGDNSVGEPESSVANDEDQDTSPQVEPSTLDIVAVTEGLVVEKDDLGDLNPTVATDDEEGHEPSNPQFSPIEELENEPIDQQPAEEADGDDESLWTLDSSDDLDEQSESVSSDQQLADEGEFNETTTVVEYTADALVEALKAKDVERRQQSDEMSRQPKAQQVEDRGPVEGESSEGQSALTQGITDEGGGVEDEQNAEQLESMHGSFDDVVDEPSSNQPREVVEDTDKAESSSQHSTQSSDISDGLDLENEALPLEENDTVPLLIKLLGADDTTAQQKEDLVLDLLRTCITNSSRVQVYKTKGIPVLTNLVRHGETFLTQLYALHCLSWFTFSFSKLRESDFMELNNCVREPSHEEMLSLLHELQSADDEVKERAALHSSCVATSGAGDALRQLGVLPLLIEQLKDGTDNQKLWATEALVTLASDSNENSVAITRGGAIPPLVLLLRSGTDMHKQEAAYALGNLAANNEVNRAKIAREGAIPPMVEFVKSATDAQNQWAVYALGSLSLNNEENRVLIAQEGAIRPLVKLLRVGTRAQKQWAAYTLGNLAHNDANRVEITLHGAIVPLVQLLRTGTAMQKQRAAFALGNLACDNDTVTTDFDEAILPLVNLVRTGSDSQKEDAAYTLGNLAANNGARRAEIGRAGAIAPLVKLLKIGDGEQKQWAAFALRCLAYDNHLNRMAIVKEGAIDALAAIVEEGTKAQKKEAALALEHLAVKDGAATDTFIPDRVMTPLMDTISLNANVAAAAALNTLETVREGVLPLFRKLMKPEAAVKTESASQNLGLHTREGPKDATDVRVVAGAW